MKLFSISWKSSSDQSKQRKYRLNAPLHIKRGLVSAHLAPELRGRHNARSMPLREGDTVKVMKGEFAGLTGKVNRVDLRKSSVYIDGAERIRKDGTKSFFPLKSSSLLLVGLVVDDKRRVAALARKTDGKKSKGTAATKAETKQHQQQQIRASPIANSVRSGIETKGTVKS